MNWHYDKEQASEWWFSAQRWECQLTQATETILHAHMEESAQYDCGTGLTHVNDLNVSGQVRRFVMTRLILGSLQAHSCEAVEFSDPPTVRLTQSCEGTTQETVVKLAGILCSKTLPPIYSLCVIHVFVGPTALSTQRRLTTGPCRRSQADEHVRYLRQFVRLTGLGAPSFDGCGVTFDEVVGRMRAAEGVANVEDFTFGRYEGHFAVDLHTRYLTERRLVPGEPTYPFPADIDPNNVLEEARGARYVRVQDNIVQYARLEKDGNGGLW